MKKVTEVRYYSDDSEAFISERAARFADLNCAVDYGFDENKLTQERLNQIIKYATEYRDYRYPAEPKCHEG